MLLLVSSAANAELFLNHWDGSSAGMPDAWLPRVEVSSKRDLNYSIPVAIKGTGKRPTFREGSSGGASSANPAPANTAEPASDQNTKPNCQNPASDKPVVIASGEKFKAEPDFVSVGPFGLSLERTYRSFGTAGRMFGAKWLSEFDYAPLKTSGCYRSPDYPGVCLPTAVVFTEPDGATFTYSNTSNGDTVYRVRNSQAMGALTFNGPGAGWQLYKDRKTYAFNSNGVITSIREDGGGQLLTFTYGGPSTTKPTQVTNRFGQTVKFTWDTVAGRVTQITDPNNGVWAYAYDANGMLSSVTSPGSSPDVRTYLYEDVTDKTLLTGISINGMRYSTYKYFANKRVQESGLTGGEERDTFVYGTNQTTVTNAAGQPTTYNFATVQGALKVTSISRSATSSCAAASAQTVYDANGWVDYTLDWNGVKTDYSYDVAGKLLQVTEAAGTTVAATRVNIWTGDRLTETTWRDAANAAYAKITYTYVTSGSAAGRLASETRTDLRGGATRQVTYTYTFAAGDKITAMTVSRALPSGSANTTYAYDANGNVASIPTRSATWSVGRDTTATGGRHG